MVTYDGMTAGALRCLCKALGQVLNEQQNDRHPPILQISQPVREKTRISISVSQRRKPYS